ncbi:beta-1,4 N-acetylgalactosaminyltransferase 2-like [Acipenser ruthenus]|uniref:beta-1,4 N-acetylgalactosaminyltransferase 2-like n=1 Tax=Acipenser ruthenus TaxID=7906 RepID=UPI002741AEB9|nr:beta-1,4 N-acetylgalactosaminyltransferase 2-like [Acipenser ruthenus]
MRSFRLKWVIMVFVVVFGIMGIFVWNMGLNLTALSSTTDNVKQSFVPMRSQEKRANCSCRPGPTFYKLENYVDKNELNEVAKRREAEYKQHLKRESSPLDTLLIAQPNSPLRYPIQGVTALPLQTITIPELSVQAPFEISYQVSLHATQGTLNTEVPGYEDEVQGRGEHVMKISTSTLDDLNHILNYTTYTSTVYEISTADLVSFKFKQYWATFPILIRQPMMPKLYDPGADKKISSLVTITTKTFLRYDSVRRLIDSIRTFYPDIKIIVADDSFIPEKINGSNVEHYIMPPAKGWFAGRNLAVSQVTTKYFLWVDDDFLFTKETKIEKLVEVMETIPKLDVVGGTVAGNDFKFQLVYEEGDEEGGCLHQRNGHLKNVPGFPACVVTSGVVNFFLARPEPVLNVGFDPRLNRVAHSEFFFDGLGALLVGSCGDVSIGHQPADKSQGNEMNEMYRKFRTNTNEQFKMKLFMYYFKNHLKCFSKN